MKRLLLLMLCLSGCDNVKITNRTECSGLTIYQFDNGTVGVATSPTQGIVFRRTPQDWNLINQAVQDLSKAEK